MNSGTTDKTLSPSSGETAITDAHLRLLIEHLPTLCWLAKPDGYIFWYNPGWHEYCGTTPQEMEGWGWQSVHDHKFLPLVLERWRSCIAIGAPFEMTFPLRGAHGEFRPFLTRVRPIKDSRGEVLWWVGTNTDVTPQMEAEAALRASEAKLRALNADLERRVTERAHTRGRSWQVTPDLMGALDSNGYFKTSNPAWQTLLGWSEEEVAGVSIFELLHPDDVEQTRATFELTQRGQPAIQFPNRYRCKDGGYRWISWVGVPEGDLVYCIGRDITAEKAQAAELAEQRLQRDLLWESSPDLLIAVDFSGTVLRVNPAWTDILGYQPEELLGQHIMSFVVPEDIPLTQQALQDATGGPMPIMENRYRHKDGSARWFSWVASPRGAAIYATGRHITVVKESQAALARAEEALRQAQKMEAVGQLTGGLAHDFNNLLVGITGALELLEKRIEEGRVAGVERYISVAQGSARRAAALTQRLLAFARRQTLDPKPTDVNRLISGMEELIRRTMGPDVRVEVVGAGGLWLTQIDSSQLENSLLNLCINARDAMTPNGGRLTIETANKWLDQRSAQERELPPGQYVSLCVSDTGTGMTAEMVERAFEPFFTTKPLGQGTGLGLSMVYGFARQSGGQVRIYTELGKGTTMCLYLPRYTGTEIEVEPDLTNTLDPGAGETVMVVDDEDAVRMLVVEVLEDNNYAAIEAADGPAGLKILESDVRIDLLITDVGLPGGLNGRQLADAARLSRPDLKVLFITGYAENAVVGNGHLEPGMEILTKPFTMATLATRVRDLIDRKGNLSRPR